MKRVWQETRALFFPDGRVRALPRFDYMIIAAAMAGGLLLVVGDVYQRAIGRHMEMLDIDAHWNIETWFHAAILMGAAFAAAGIAFTHFDRRRSWWLAVAAGLAFFSMDKTTSIHERVGAKLESVLDLPSGSARLAWIAAWSPIILVVVAALVLCVWQSRSGRLQLWSAGLLLGGAAKIALEMITYPAIRFFGATQSRGWFYGIEANVEETAQLIGFACAFAGFAQFFVDRLMAFARDDLEAFDAAQVPVELPAALARRLPSFGRPASVASPSVRPAEET